jgi:hypothetical protein
MADCGFLPLPVVCIQCGTSESNPSCFALYHVLMPSCRPKSLPCENRRTNSWLLIAVLLAVCHLSPTSLPVRTSDHHPDHLLARCTLLRLLRLGDRQEDVGISCGPIREDKQLYTLLSGRRKQKKPFQKRVMPEEHQHDAARYTSGGSRSGMARSGLKQHRGLLSVTSEA